MSGRLPPHRCPPGWHELEVGADISWWLIDRRVDSPIEQALDSSVPARIAWDWSISPARQAWNPLKSGLCQDTRRNEVYECCAICYVWPAQPNATHWK
jgi:hypothetical protein